MILCVCRRGNVRSATLAAILRDCYGEMDVVAVGVDTTTPKLMCEFVKMANRIYVVGSSRLQYSFGYMTANSSLRLSDWGDKLNFIEIGADTWGQAMHPDLVLSLITWLLENKHYTAQSPLFGTVDAYIQAAKTAYTFEIP